MTDLVKKIAAETKGTTIVSMKTETVADLKKRNNPYYGRVMKTQTKWGIMGFDYQNSINNLAAKEGVDPLKAKKRHWGNVIHNGLFVENKGKIYLRLKQEGEKDVKYFLDGMQIDESVIAEWLKTPTKSSTQSNLKGEVKVRNIEVGNIKEIKFKGEVIIP